MEAIHLYSDTYEFLKLMQFNTLDDFGLEVKYLKYWVYKSYHIIDIDTTQPITDYWLYAFY